MPGDSKTMWSEIPTQKAFVPVKDPSKKTKSKRTLRDAITELMRCGHAREARLSASP